MRRNIPPQTRKITAAAENIVSMSLMTKLTLTVLKVAGSNPTVAATEFLCSCKPLCVCVKGGLNKRRLDLK